MSIEYIKRQMAQQRGETYDPIRSYSVIDRKEFTAGEPARLTTDEVVENRRMEVELLRLAARLVTAHPENLALFERFLDEIAENEG